MTRNLVFIFLVFLSSVLSFGQDSYDFERIHETFQERYSVVDTACMEVVYSHSMFDPIKKEKEVVYEILAIGDNYSRYIDYIDRKSTRLNSSH